MEGDTPMSDLQTIFGTLKPLLQAYQPPLVPQNDTERYFDLWSLKPMVIDGRKRKEIFFAGLIIQKDYVGFYFMPIYAETDLKPVFKPELLRLLKGKSCFHIKKLDDELLRQIEAALKIGYELYQERGWV
jgi:hypothetical protein